MTDKMLSAEKVRGFVSEHKEILSNDDGHYVAAVPLGLMLDAIIAGQLDADCPKCGGDGVEHIHRAGGIHEYWDCDCPAGRGGSEK